MAKWIIAECSKDRMGMFELFGLSFDIEKLNGKCMNESVLELIVNKWYSGF